MSRREAVGGAQADPGGDSRAPDHSPGPDRSRVPGGARGWLRSAWFVARKDVAYMLRRRETLVWVFVMPILFFWFIGTVTGGFASPGDDEEPDPLAFRVPGEPGFLADVLSDRLEGEGFRVDRVADDSAAARYPRLLRFPPPPAAHPTATAAVLAGEPLTLRFRRRGEGPAAGYDAVRVRRAAYSVVADLAVLAAARPDGAPPPTPADFRRLAGMPRALTLRTVSAGERVDPPSGFAQAVPGTLVMFTMLILLTSGAIMLVTEREQGLLRRLAATPITRGAVVAGKWGGKMALGLVQIAFGMTAGALLFGMDWGAAPGVLAAVLLAWAALNASLGILLAGVARTTAQTAGIGVLATMVLAALGGCWWPIEVTPPWMRTLALFLPTGWTMDALHRVVSFGQPASAALPHILGLAAASLLAGWGATRAFRYE